MARAPRTRGWTGAPDPGAGAEGESPAHAGMDRSGSRPRADPPREPRARGDGPYAGGWHSRSLVRAPRTRGWTVADDLPRGVGHESPAHAGMDPGLCPFSHAMSREPRARGDGPDASVAWVEDATRAPRTRGWTGCFFGGGGHPVESPAHAGMDRTCPALPRTNSREPRARGDGPNRPRPDVPWPVRAPRTRGWTFRCGPAHASLPESPAHAGMDRRPGCNGAGPGREPRARGDGPITRLETRQWKRRAPRTRGWTAVRVRALRRRCESPAHAGMDRRWCRARPNLRWRAPRTRGWTGS